MKLLSGSYDFSHSYVTNKCLTNNRILLSNMDIYLFEFPFPFSFENLAVWVFLFAIQICPATLNL